MSSHFKSQFESRTITTKQQRVDAKLDWKALEQIYEDYNKSHGTFVTLAETYANIMQKLPNVHSVRWRVKDADHLIDKIIRKLADASTREKYLDIDASNYKSIVTDLIGVRALHLFKQDWMEINAEINKAFDLRESIVIYHRGGDTFSDEEIKLIDEKKLTKKEHDAGYRSIHYLVSANVDKRWPVTIELQIRSIYEEAWSEIDHKLRYPNLVADPLIESSLLILNRLSGNSDELATFIKSIQKQQADHASELAAERAKTQAASEALDKALNEISIAKSDKKSTEALKVARSSYKQLFDERRSLPSKETDEQIRRRPQSLRDLAQDLPIRSTLERYRAITELPSERLFRQREEMMRSTSDGIARKTIKRD